MSLKQPYQEAVPARPSESVRRANDQGPVAAALAALDASRPSLRDLYVPMTEVHRRAGKNGLTCVSTFTGGGGSTTGFAWAGWRELAAVEFVASARKTLASNYSPVVVQPEEVAHAAQRWIEEHGEAADLLRWPRQNGREAESPGDQVDWLTTLEEAARSGPKRMEAVERLRHDVSLELLRDTHDPGKMLLWGDDVRGLDGEALLEVLGLQPGELDCLEGSPPCASFSPAGLRSKGFGGIRHYSEERSQRTDDLFSEFARLLRALQPRSFVAENVAGLTQGDALTKVLVPLMTDLQKVLGYEAEWKIVHTEDYGVPQARPRLLIQGVRRGLVDRKTREQLFPRWPTPSDALRLYTVRNALEAAGDSPDEEVGHAWLGSKNELRARLGRELPPEVERRWRRTIKRSELAQRGEPVEAGADGDERLPFSDDLDRYELGRIWKRLGQPGRAPANKAFQMMRCHLDLPAPTITATGAKRVSAAGATHPFECRKFTVNEYRWLCGFPPDYHLDGELDQQAERLGRAVPPYLMMQIAKELAAVLARAKPVPPGRPVASFASDAIEQEGAAVTSSPAVLRLSPRFRRILETMRDLDGELTYTEDGGAAMLRAFLVHAVETGLTDGEIVEVLTDRTCWLPDVVFDRPEGGRDRRNYGTAVRGLLRSLSKIRQEVRAPVEAVQTVGLVVGAARTDEALRPDGLEARVLLALASRATAQRKVTVTGEHVAAVATELAVRSETVQRAVTGLERRGYLEAGEGGWRLREPVERAESERRRVER